MNYARWILDDQGEHMKRSRTEGPTIYRIVVRDELGERYASAFEEMEIETEGGQTVLTGTVIDQPRLHSILDRIGAMGLQLVSVEIISQEAQVR